MARDDILDNKRKAISFMLISTFSFTLMQLFIRLAKGIPFYEKVISRDIISILVTLFILTLYKKPIIPKKKNLVIMLIRCFLAVLGTCTYFYSVEKLVMSDAAMLGKMSIFFITIFAAIFIKEKLNKKSIIILFIIFISALLIVKPKFDLSIIPAVIGLLSSVFAGAAWTILRFLKGKEDAFTIVFLSSLFSIVVIFPFAARDYVMPDMEQLFYLVMIGINACLGQIFVTLSYRYAPASQISIYSYISIIFALILGFIFFREIPDLMSVTGSIIVVSMAYLNYRLIQ